MNQDDQNPSLERVKEITDWVRRNSDARWHQIDVIADGTVDIKGDIKLISGRFTKLPVKFNSVWNGFDCSNEGLTTLEGCPEKVGKQFMAYGNEITTLVGGPKVVHGGYNVLNCPLETLEGLPNHVSMTLWLPWRPGMGYLRAVIVNGATHITVQDEYNRKQQGLMDILNRYRGRGVNGVMPCAAELIKAGYREAARL
jgi:hypothetical protein